MAETDYEKVIRNDSFAQIILTKRFSLNEIHDRDLKNPCLESSILITLQSYEHYYLESAEICKIVFLVACVSLFVCISVSRLTKNGFSDQHKSFSVDRLQLTDHA